MAAEASKNDAGDQLSQFSQDANKSSLDFMKEDYMSTHHSVDDASAAPRRRREVDVYSQEQNKIKAHNRKY